jgi:hypothetical protein
MQVVEVGMLSTGLAERHAVENCPRPDPTGTGMKDEVFDTLANEARCPRNSLVTSRYGMSGR